MTFLKRSFSLIVDMKSMSNQKKSARVTRLLAPFVLAFMMFACVGLTTPGSAFASTTSTCGDQVRASAEAQGYSTGVNEGIINLVQNTCTGLFHAEALCTTSGNIIDVFINVIVKLGVTHEYNEINVTCASVGQTFETASVTYQPSLYFCAWGFGDDPTGDGGPAIACISNE